MNARQVQAKAATARERIAFLAMTWLPALAEKRRELLLLLADERLSDMKRAQLRTALSMLEERLSPSTYPTVLGPTIISQMPHWLGANNGRIGATAALSDFREQLAALEAQLPSTDQIAEAERRATTLLLPAARRASARVSEAWPEFISALEAATAAARALHEANEQATQTAVALGDHAERFGLDVQVPRRVEAVGERRHAGYLVNVLRDVADSGVIDARNATALTKVRQRLSHVPAADVPNAAA